MRRDLAPAATLVVVAVALPLVGCAAVDGHVSGTVTQVLDTEDPSTRALVVELDEGTVAGSRVVHLTYDRAVAQCLGGGDLEVEELAPGSEVRAVLFDSGDVDAMNPPGVRARELAIRC